jgi:hypothetical protein
LAILERKADITTFDDVEIPSYCYPSTIDDGWWPISVGEFTRQMVELAKLRDSGEVGVVAFNDGAERLRRQLR